MKQRKKRRKPAGWSDRSTRTVDTLQRDLARAVETLTRELTRIEQKIVLITGDLSRRIESLERPASPAWHERIRLLETQIHTLEKRLPQ